MSFEQLNLDPRILKALKEIGFEKPTDIQAKSIPIAMEGKDIIGESMTGSGKTAAFAIPIVQKMEAKKGVQALILAPTRELAMQISQEFEKFSKYMGLHVAIVYGGVSIVPQIDRIRHSEIVVGTPGRLVDHLTRRTLDLSGLKVMVLDETDRMLDMGFIDDIRKIFSKVPNNRQTMLFSATVPEEIRYLTQNYMKHPIKISAQKHVSRHLLKHTYYDVNQDQKPGILAHLIKIENPELAMVFCSTRHMSDILARKLYNFGIQAKAIHGGLSQPARTNVLEGFHKGRPKILIATDVAARGLDIKTVTHVFNFDIPKTVDDYTHRIGRTARFGKEGKAISLLCKHDHDSFRRIIQHIKIEKEYAKDFDPKQYQDTSEKRQQKSYEKRYDEQDHKQKRFRRMNREYYSRR
ncbi:MAG: DEAD/DEAH box helicase [Candidatus Aenigmarchaeota archaeon]|nr:DEAD/DEAH box helicase [Candidatus Aenigmarchaeota archaeon]